MNCGRKILKQLSSFAKNAVPVILCSTYSCLFLYFVNADEASFAEILQPLLLMLGVGLAGYFLVGIACRSWSKSVLCASLCALLFSTYRHLENLLMAVCPALKYWHILPIVLFALAWISFLYCLKAKEDIISVINLVICLVFGALTVINFVTAVPDIIANATTKNQIKAEVIQESGVDNITANKPNIYHFLLDEFSAAEVMQEYYDYDLSWFTDALEQDGFVVGKNNRNETIDTTTIMANLFSLDYVVNNGTPSTTRKEIARNGRVQELLTENDYKMIGLGYAYQSFNVGEETALSAAKTVGGQTLAYLALENTAIYPFVQMDNSKERQIIVDSFAWFDDKQNLTGHNRYVLSYQMIAHEPFLFDENGGYVDEVNQNNWQDKKYYKGHYIYGCKLLLKAVDNILKNDPTAIIIIQSDHSARAADDFDLYLKWIGLHDARRCFNAVYYGGEEFENIDSISGVNVLRSVFSKLFDNVDLPRIEEPDYYNWKGGAKE